MVNQITREIIANIWNNSYSIIWDEYTYIEQRTVIILHKLGWYIFCCTRIPNIKSETIVNIKVILLRFQLSLQLCYRQCFDGTSNILGKRSGVSIQIYKEQWKACYSHWHCHSLNLSIKDVTRSSKMLSDVVDTAGEISVLITQSNFIEITLRHGCSPVNLLHVFRTPFSRNTSGWLLLDNTSFYKKRFLVGR